jgi:hypothetical protein
MYDLLRFGLRMDCPRLAFKPACCLTRCNRRIVIQKALNATESFVANAPRRLKTGPERKKARQLGRAFGVFI